MTIQHAVIADPNIHEPKGVAVASSGSVYAADGAGSGIWKRVDSLALKGLSGDGGSANKLLITDGTNGYTLKEAFAYGSMTITGNTNAFAIGAAVDPNLNTNSDYVLFTGTGAPWVAGTPSFGITFSVDRITVPVTGVYQIELWSTITTFPSNVAKVSVKHRINGGTFSARHPVAKSNAVGDVGNLDGFGLVALSAGDYIQLYMASSVAGGLIFSDVNTTIRLIRAT